MIFSGKHYIMKILVYLRKEPLKSFYTNLAAYISDNNFFSVSEFRNTGDIWLGKYLYQDNKPVFFNNNDANDIYLRCRFLRKYPFEEAQMLINRMANGIMNIIQNNKPEIILAPLIDNYTLDILERISRKNNITYISFVGHFFNGYSRISSRGEYNYFPREVTNHEIESVLNSLIKTDYTPFYHEKVKSSSQQKQKFLYKQLLKKYIYFPFMKIVERDPKNYHYNTTNEKSNKINHLRLNNHVDKYFTKISAVSPSPYNIYLPLHLTPEATVDYWCDDPDYGVFYMQNILSIIDNSSRNFHFLVKEHPAMYLLRNLEFYERLLSYKNVTIVHPYENSNVLLDKVNYVLTENGSVGVEALIRNKIVIANSSNYYSELHPNIHRMNFISDAVAHMNVEKYDNKLFIKDILQGNMKGRLINNKNIFNSDIKLLYNQIKEYSIYKSNNYKYKNHGD